MMILWTVHRQRIDRGGKENAGSGWYVVAVRSCATNGRLQNRTGNSASHSWEGPYAGKRQKRQRANGVDLHSQL